MNLVLNLTEQCNLRCSYCYYNHLQEERFCSMDLNILERAIAYGFQRSLELGDSFLNITFLAENLFLKELILKGVEIAKNTNPKR